MHRCPQPRLSLARARDADQLGQAAADIEGVGEQFDAPALGRGLLRSMPDCTG